jgi:hypothetical protein
VIGLAWVVVILWCLAPFGLAWRGFSLLLMGETRPGQIVSLAGAVAMVSVWIIGGLSPVIAVHVQGVLNEFDLATRPATELLLALLELMHHFSIVWYPFVFALGLFVMVVPEVFFYRTRIVSGATEKDAVG